VSTDPAALPTRTLLPERDVGRFVHVERVMGLPVSLHVRGPGLAPGTATAAVAAAVTRAVSRLHDVDHTFSTYRDGSAVSRIRRGELALDDAPADVLEVVALCREAAGRTGGWFDAWLPPDRLFDPTGLVKGWVVEQVARDLAAALPGHDVLVNAGGDVVVACDRTDTPDWVVAVEDPGDRNRLLARIPLRTGAVATSGTAARGAHVLDPRTGAPAAGGLRAVTVVGPSLLWADVHATAALAEGPRSRERLAALGDHVALLVGADGTQTLVREGPGAEV
jgi:thiamine biosynthesis lipoprotein